MFDTDDCGIFIGRTTIPLPLFEGQKFYEQEIRKGIFGKYKENILKNAFNKEKEPVDGLEEFEAYFYETRGYYLFGPFDLAVIAFVDDFKLGSKTFHPYSYLSEQALHDVEDRPLEPENFIFQTTTGFSPWATGKKDARIGLFEKARDTFLKRDLEGAKFPLIGITELKLNNGLHIGSGNAMVQLAANMIRAKLEANPDHGEHFEFILLQSYSWNEFLLLIFSDSYRTIIKQVLEVREMTLGELSVFDDKAAGYFDQVQQNCLLKSLIDQKAPDSASLLNNAHVFVYSHTTFGFDLELIPLLEGKDESALSSQFKPILHQSLNLNMLFHVKPGHLKTVARQFGDKGAKWNVNVGSGDLVLPLSENDVNITYERVLSQDDLRQLRPHLRRIQTLPALHIALDELSGDTVKEHFYYTDELHQFAYGLQHIRELRELLLRCKIGKTLRERIINMYVNYNSGIRDPLLFTYFADLKPFLDKTLLDIADMAIQPKQAVEATSIFLETAAADFEKAFRNRFYLSYLMSHVTDYNMEHNGGIQQLVSIFDSVYKIITEVLLLPYNKRPSLCVSSIPRIDSNENFVELSYAHLLQPSIFLSVATATAAKHFFTYAKQEDEKTLHLLEQKTLLVQNLPLIEDLPFLENLSDLFGDLVNYYLTFNKDSDLFLFWYWHHFLQNPDMYTNEGTVDEELFVLYLLRLMLLFEFLDRDPRHFGARIVAPTVELQDLWFRWFPRTQTKLEQLLKGVGADPLGDWFSLAKAVINEVLVIDNYCGLSENQIDKPLAQERHFLQILKKKGLAIMPDTREEMLNQLAEVRKEDLEFLSDTIMSMLEKGKVFRPERNSDRPLSFYTHAIMLGYLKLLKQQFGGNISVLYRLESNGYPSDSFEEDTAFKRNYADFTFDPRGGLFLTGLQARRAYFRYRIALFHTLNGLAARAKVALFNGIKW